MITETFELEVDIQPYPGLRPFREDETHLYFGREGHRGELLKRLTATRFVAVIGTSGSGKSSLVRAGLLPDLLSGYLAGSGSDWVMVESTPGADPLGRLAAALQNAGWTTDAAALRTNSSHIVDLAARHLVAGQHLLVLVDQFEELFRLKASDDPAEDADEKAAFVRLLLNAGGQRTDVTAQHPRVHVVMAMRSEFLGRASVYRGLPEAIDQGQYLIPRLSREQLRRAIEAPARVASGELEEALVQRLLNELGDDQDQLPVLQHALMRCWQFRDGAGRIGIEAYEKSGQLARALSIDANEALAETRSALGDRGVQIVTRAFQGLRETDVNGGQTRRPTTLQVLCELASCTLEELTTALAPFRRRSFVLPAMDTPLTTSTLIDISHEALLRRWDALRRWIDEDDLDRARYRRLATRAAEEHDSERPQYLVPPQLDMLVRFWADRNPPKAWAVRHHPGYEQAKAFLDESEKQRRAREREEADRQAEESRQKQALADAVAKRMSTRRRALVGSVLAVAILAVGGFVLWSALVQGRRLQGLLFSAKSTSIPEANVGARLQLAVEAARQLQDLESRHELLKILFAAPRELDWGSDLKAARSVAISPGDQRLYAVAGDSLRSIELATGREIVAVPLSEYEGEDLDPFLMPSGDDKLLMLRDTFVSVLDAGTLRVLSSPIADASAFTAATDGRYAAFLAADAVILCDLSRNCESSPRYDVTHLSASDLELSPDGKYLVMIGRADTGGQQISFFETAPWKERKTRPVEGVDSLAMRVDRQHVHVCTAETLRQYDAYDDTLDERVVRQFNPTAESCRFFGERTVTSHADGAIRVWDATGALVTQMTASSRVDYSWWMALGERTLVTAGDRIQVWDFTPYGRQNLAVRLSDFVKDDAYAHGDGTLVALDSAAISAGPNLALGPGRLLALSQSLSHAIFRVQGELVLAALDPSGPPRERWTWRLDPQRPSIRQVLFSPDERHVAITSSGLEGPSTVILDAATGMQLRALKGKSAIFFAPTAELLTFEGPKLAIESIEKEAQRPGPVLQLEPATGGESEGPPPGGDSQPATPTAVAFSRDGRRLALAVSRGQTSIVEFYEWPGLRRLGGGLQHSASVTGLSFRSDNLALVTSTTDETTHVWDVATQVETLRIPPPGPQRTTAAFTPSGRVAILQDGRLTLVSVDPDELLAEACRRVEKNLTPAQWVEIVGGDITPRKTCLDRP